MIGFNRKIDAEETIYVTADANSVLEKRPRNERGKEEVLSTKLIVFESIRRRRREATDDRLR